MKIHRIFVQVLAAALLLAVAAPLAAQSTARLRGDFATEASALEGKIEGYFDAREREKDAMAELARLSERLDTTLGDPHSGRKELINLEAQLTVARERACAMSEETAGQRAEMYESMKRLAALVRELERLGITTGGDRGGVAGAWRVEAQPTDVVGFLDLRQEGALVIGTLRLSNGTEGSVKGTFSGRRITLEIVDSRRGTIGDVEGELDPEAGEIVGTWHARELAGGRPSAGEWTAYRLE